MQKETVYEDCNHSTTWMKNHVENAVIKGVVKELERDRLRCLFP
jgi:hypothetical protein